MHDGGAYEVGRWMDGWMDADGCRWMQIRCMRDAGCRDAWMNVFYYLFKSCRKLCNYFRTFFGISFLVGLVWFE